MQEKKILNRDQLKDASSCSLFKSKKNWLVFLLLILTASCFFWIKNHKKSSLSGKNNANVPQEKTLSEEETTALVNGKVVALYNQGKLDELEKILLEKLKTNPNDVKLLTALGTTYAQENVYLYSPSQAATKARVYLEKALRLDPENTQAIVTLGYTYEIEGRLDEAIENYNEAIKKNGNIGYFYSRLGHALEMKNDYQGALQNYQKALELTQDTSAYINLARLYGKGGRIKMAIDTFEKALLITENSEEKAGIYASLGSIYSNIIPRTEENKNKAVEYLNKAIELNNKNSLAYANLEEEYYKRITESIEKKDFSSFQENIKKLETYFNEAQKINPNESVAYIWAGMTALIIGKNQEAYNLFEIGLKKAENDWRLFGEEKDVQKARFLLGQGLLLANSQNKENNIDEALGKIEQALKLNKKLLEEFINPELKKPNGGYFANLKNNEKFQEMIETVKKNNPSK